MDKLSDAWQYIKKKLDRYMDKNRDESADSADEIGGHSMNEGEPGRIMGIKRSIVQGVGMFFIVVFSLAFIFASSDDTKDVKKETEPPKTSNSQTAELGNTQNGLPDDYASFAAMNKKKNEVKEKESTKEQKSETKEKKETVKTQVPVNYSPLPRIAAPAPIVSSNAESDRKQSIEKKDERLKAAIAFTLGDGNISENEQNKSNAETESKESKNTARQYIAPNDHTIIAGTIIPVRLLTGINSDLTGQVLAQVLSDVYDSATGTKIIIPQGTKIAGIYDNQAVTNGRVPLTFRQLNFPDGGSLVIADNLVAVDEPGYAGVKGKVHHHTGQKISADLLGSAIAAMGSVAAGNTSSNNNTYTAGQLATQGALANLINVTSDMFQKASDVNDTVTIEPGYEFNLYVTENIVLE